MKNIEYINNKMDYCISIVHAERDVNELIYRYKAEFKSSLENGSQDQKDIFKSIIKDLEKIETLEAELKDFIKLFVNTNKYPLGLNELTSLSEKTKEKLSSTSRRLFDYISIAIEWDSQDINLYLLMNKEIPHLSALDILLAEKSLQNWSEPYKKHLQVEALHRELLAKKADLEACKDEQFVKKLLSEHEKKISNFLEKNKQILDEYEIMNNGIMNALEKTGSRSIYEALKNNVIPKIASKRKP